MSTPPKVTAPALSELLAHTRWVEELARALVRDPEVARDLAQSTLLAAIEQREAPHGSVRGWLAKVLRNQARERGRREAVRARVESRGSRPEALPATDELVERAESERRVVAAVMALDEPHRSTLLLRYFEDLSPEEIARRSNMPLATVTSRITRAHARLRERLTREQADASWLSALAPILLRAKPGEMAVSASTPLAPKVFIMSFVAKSVAALVVVAFLAWWIWPKESAKTELAAISPKPAVESSVSSQSTAATLPIVAPTEPRQPVTTPTPSVETAAAPVAAAPTAPAIATTGRIYGQIFRPDGKPAAQRKIRMLLMGKGPEKYVTTEDQGHFDAPDLDPGVWALSTWPDTAEIAALGKSNESTMGGMVYMTQRTVDLERGAAVEVVLGKPPVDGVHAHGRLLREGAASDGYMTWLPDGRDSMDRQRLATAGAEKGYELTLDQAGRYVVVVIQNEVREEFVVDVPRGADFVRDFELPSAGLRGRVTTSDGRAVVGAHVDLVPSAAHSPRHPSANIMFSRPTDAEGKFDFRCLAPARYSLGVHGGTVGAEKLSASAIARRDVVVGPNVASPDLSIVVATGSRVKGSVHATIGKVANTYVFVFAGDGEALNPLDGITADKDGAFELFALAPGHYFAVAAGGERWSKTVGFDVSPEGTSANLSLDLEPGAKLTVDIRGQEPAWIDIRDVNQCSLSTVFDKHVFDRAVNRDWSATSFTYRVPAGTYDIGVMHAEGRVAKAHVELVAGDDKHIDLGRK